MSAHPKYLLVCPRLPNDDTAVHAASVAIRRERAHNRLRHASHYLCVRCMKRAQHHHHCSYLPSDLLCVIPLCGRCHMRVHRAGLSLPPLGVVPTAVGLVRIAIADAPVPTRTP